MTVMGKAIQVVRQAPHLVQVAPPPTVQKHYSTRFLAKRAHQVAVAVKAAAQAVPRVKVFQAVHQVPVLTVDVQRKICSTKSTRNQEKVVPILRNLLRPQVAAVRPPARVLQPAVTADVIRIRMRKKTSSTKFTLNQEKVVLILS